MIVVSCCAVLWRELLVAQAASSALHSSSPVSILCLENMDSVLRMWCELKVGPLAGALKNPARGGVF